MSETQPVIILESNEKVRKILGPALQEAGLGADCRIEAGAEGTALHVGEAVLGKPVRLGAVLDAARRTASERAGGPAVLRIGPFTLDRAGGTLEKSPKNKRQAERIRLTEKEVHILALLHNAGGAAVERQALLDAVWGYGEGIETHTLETHIYRLRQKIEEDAAAPTLLLTEGNGYRLSI